MPRPADPQRKPVLLEQIIEHLLDRPLATLSLRTIAAGLGVSTYTLVYHFGSRAQLLHDIVEAISSHQLATVAIVDREGGDVESHLRNLRESWAWILVPRNLQLQRLEFEASMLEAQDGEQTGVTRLVFERWHRTGREALKRMGLPDAAADLEARIMTDTMYGLQYDLIVNRNIDAANDAFAGALEAYGDRIAALGVGGARSKAQPGTVEA
jgi:AcrR family transcriptional regulator